jgi:hypothetical protein
MKNIVHVAVLFMVTLSFSLEGCAVYVKPHPSSDAIASIGKNKITQKAYVVISDRDLALEQSVHFGLIGYLNPVSVKVGETLKVYSEEYFNELFNEVAFTNQPSDSIGVVFEIKGFNISAFEKAAHLELHMAINDKTNKQIFEKLYLADGKGHFPLYSGNVTEQQHVQETTEEAFQKVFDVISKDIQKITFM